MEEQTNWLCHYGVKGMKWGVRRYQDYNGRLTVVGKKQRNTSTYNRNAASVKSAELKSKYQKYPVPSRGDHVSDVARRAYELPYVQKAVKDVKKAMEPRREFLAEPVEVIRELILEDHKEFYKHLARNRKDYNRWIEEDRLELQQTRKTMMLEDDPDEDTLARYLKKKGDSLDSMYDRIDAANEVLGKAIRRASSELLGEYGSKKISSTDKKTVDEALREQIDAVEWTDLIKNRYIRYGGVDIDD